MDYLTQYYKNRAEQLQQELKQLTEAYLAKGDSTYYQPDGNEPTIMGWGDVIRGALGFTSKELQRQVRILARNLTPAQLNDPDFMRGFMRTITKEQAAVWKNIFPDAVRIADGFNGVSGYTYWMYKEGKQMIVIVWDEATGTWRKIPGNVETPWGNTIDGVVTFRPGATPVRVDPKDQSLDDTLDGALLNRNTEIPPNAPQL